MRKENLEDSLTQKLKQRQVPVLILDTRWHALFPQERKPAVIRKKEEELNNLLKEQGKLVNECKDLKRVKKKLMDDVVANMGNMTEKQSSDNSRLIQETGERLEQDSRRLMEIPFQIKRTNQELLLLGMKICYERMSGRREELEALEQEVNAMREILKSKVAYKTQLEEEIDKTYNFIHNLLGPEVVELFDANN